MKALTKLSLTLAAIAILSATAPLAAAGDLNPPPGPIQPTNRVALNRQSISLPYLIDKPGSYVLTSNLIGVPGQDGIVVDADNVTIDLNGFSLIGVPGSGSGITVTPAPAQGILHRRGFVVMNGFISGWGAHGVVTTDYNPGADSNSVLSNCRISDLTIRDCGIDGLRLAQAYSPDIVERVSAMACGGVGFRVASAAIIRECSATSNASDGFNTDSDSNISHCSATNNGGIGFNIGRGAIANCKAQANGGGGIDIDQDSQAIDCWASFNGVFGIRVSFDSSVSRCHISRNSGHGITSHNLGGASRILITDCQITTNNGWGLNLGGAAGSMVYRNVVTANSSGAINAPGSDAPVSASSAAAGPNHNIAL